MELDVRETGKRLVKDTDIRGDFYFTESRRQIGSSVFWGLVVGSLSRDIEKATDFYMKYDYKQGGRSILATNLEEDTHNASTR